MKHLAKDFILRSMKIIWIYTSGYYDAMNNLVVSLEKLPDYILNSLQNQFLAFSGDYAGITFNNTYFTVIDYNGEMQFEPITSMYSTQFKDYVFIFDVANENITVLSAQNGRPISFTERDIKNLKKADILYHRGMFDFCLIRDGFYRFNDNTLKSLDGTKTICDVLIPKQIKKSDELTSYRYVTIKAKSEVSFGVEKKIKKVKVSDSDVVKVKKKGKEVIITGKSTGIVTVTAYGKKKKILGTWLINVE